MSADELVRELADVRSYSVTLDGIPLVGGKAISVIGDLRAEITRLSEALATAKAESVSLRAYYKQELAASEAARERLRKTLDGLWFYTWNARNRDKPLPYDFVLKTIHAALSSSPPAQPPASEGDAYRLRGGPGRDFPCDDPKVSECAMGECQRQRRCVLRAAPARDAGPPLPKSLHWLGDRESAEATQHALDMTGCVMYFDRQSDCLAFMRWLEHRTEPAPARDAVLEEAAQAVDAMRWPSGEYDAAAVAAACCARIRALSSTRG